MGLHRTPGSQKHSSLETQEERARSYCQTHGLALVAFFIDDQSGRRGRRPECRRAGPPEYPALEVFRTAVRPCAPTGSPGAGLGNFAGRRFPVKMVAPTRNPRNGLIHRIDLRRSGARHGERRRQSHFDGPRDEEISSLCYGPGMFHAHAKHGFVGVEEVIIATKAMTLAAMDWCGLA